METLEKRSRQWPYYEAKGTYYSENRVGGLWVKNSPTNIEYGPVYGDQVTESEGHPWPPISHRFRGDLGGPFYTARRYMANEDGTPWEPQESGAQSADPNGISMDRPGSSFVRQQISSLNRTTYIGPILPLIPGGFSHYAPASPSSDSELEAWGATAISRCKPTNSVGDAATFLGELFKDGIPSMIGSTFWKEKTQRARAAGSEYLNYQFGWAPLLSDVRKLASAVVKADSVLAQFERDSGRIVRRRYEEDPVESTEESLFKPSGYPPWPTSSTILRPGDAVLRETTKVERWFSGAFTYHLPDGNDYRSGMVRTALEAQKLLGILPTPDTLWELTPWSWAIDWFTNTGDVISNLTDRAQYGLVLRYGYVMETKTVTRTYSINGIRYKSNVTGGADAVPLTFVTVTKKRIQANPFGFGVTWEGLSPFQLSILGALGISRSPRRAQ